MSIAAGIDEQHHPRSAPRATALSRVLDVDLAQPLAFIALAAVYIASRAPFLGVSYGTDPDAWRIALSGLWLWDHHEFYPSRLPGYPVPELATAAVVKGGPLATNALTMLVALAGVWFFARIVARLELPNRALVVVGFAFTPLLWINSMTTMDYMYALTFIMGAYYFLIMRRSWLAGLMLGLAVASRSTSAVMLVPFLAYMWRDGRRHEIRPFIVTVIAVTLAAFAPIYWKYDLRLLNFYDSKVGHLIVLRLLAKDSLGLIGAAGVLLAAVVSLPRLLRLPEDILRDKHVMVWALAILMTALSFVRLPHEAAYLIPLYPFGFLIMARYFRQAALAGAVGAIVLAGFFDLTSPGEEIGVSELGEARPGRGLILSNRETMRKQIDFTRDLESLRVPDNTVVSVGFVYPIFAVRNYDDMDVGILEKDRSAISQLSDKGKTEQDGGRVTWVWLLEFEQFERFRREGKKFMYTQDAGRSTAALYEYRPGLYGAGVQFRDKPACEVTLEDQSAAQESPVCVIDLGRGPSGGSGAARTDR